MQIPKRIDKLIEQRRKHAQKLYDVSKELEEWLIDHNVSFEPEDGINGAETILNWDDSNDRIREAVENKEG